MEKLSEALGAYLPAWSVGPLVAIAVVILGWFIATIAKIIVAGAINRTGLGRKAQTVGGNIGQSLAKAVFYVIWLIFILMGLSLSLIHI